MATKKRAIGKKAAKSKPAPKKPATAKTVRGQTKTKTAPAAKKKASPKVAPAREKAAARKASFSLESRVRRHKDVAWRIIDGEAVIVTPADSVMHTLNDVGTRIWELLTGERSINQVARLLCADFDVDLARSQKDALWFVQCLQKKGLVELAD